MYIHEITFKWDKLQVKNGTFIYDEISISRLERSISMERLSPYMELAENNRAYAIALYEWNTRISEAMYSIIQGLEVTLRNAIHEVFSEDYGRPDWYDVAPLREEQRRQVEQAKERVRLDGYDPTPGRVVAELMFGFWASLSGAGYAQSLWDPTLRKAFREVRVGRKTAANRLRKIRLLRNRVAHHESIIGRSNSERDLQKDTREIIEVVSWICRTTAQWVAHTSSFDLNHGKRPPNPNAQPMLPARPI